MPESQRTRRIRDNHLSWLLLLASLLALAVFSGCFPDSDRRQARAPIPAPVVDTEAPSPETAYWRGKYENNRTEPPRQFSVASKPPRNNEFGEFEDGMFAGLDGQPSLPRLPGGQDILAMTGAPAEYGAAPAREAGSGGAGAAYPVSSPTAAGAAAAPVSGRAGIASGTRLQPIEQLVYGGDYPDIDKPELYRLMPKDVVSVTVKDHPEFSGKVTVQPDGTVRIPNSPDLIAMRGRTVDEAAEEIRRTLQLYVKGECVVRVQANRARGGYYFVFGDVLQPGRFPMGLEPVKISDAVLAANWEANPARLDADGEELGPAFPAASPRGKFIAPRSADLARVMLITPHRSQPVRTVHDIRSAMLGVTGNDPAVRPGQIIVVPSLDPARNLALGLDLPPPATTTPGLLPGQGFSGAGAAARLPEIDPATHPYRRATVIEVPGVDMNMTNSFGVQANTEAFGVDDECFGAPGGYYGTGGFCPPVSLGATMPDGPSPVPPPAAAERMPVEEEVRAMAPPQQKKRGRRLSRSAVSGIGDTAPVKKKKQDATGWNMGF